MKKRLVGLVLLVTMTASMILTSCQNNAATLEDVVLSRKPLTMEIYSVVNSNIPEEDLVLIQDEINKITKSKFMTEVHLKFFTENEYYDKLAAAFKYQDEERARLAESASISESIRKSSVDLANENRKKGITEPATRETKETVTTEESTERIVYPSLDPEKPQADIFLIRGLDEYMSLLTLGMDERLSPTEEGIVRLAPLNEDLTAKGKILHDYIYPSFLQAPKIAGDTYAIPVNHQIGEYTFLKLRNDLVAKYELDLTKVADIKDIAKFLTDVKENEPSVVPLNTAAPLEKYFDNIKDNTFPISGASGGDKVSVVNKYAKDSKLLATVALNLQYKADGIIGEGSSYAAEFVTGTYADLQSWIIKPDPEAEVPTETITNADGEVLETVEKIVFPTDGEYTYITYSAPKATAETTMAAMYGVNSATVNATRAMEVITLMNTNPEIKNLLTYGVEGTHYIIDDNDRVQRVNDHYSINPLYSGNEYLAALEAGQPEDLHSNAKLQNLESVTSTTINFDLNYAKLKPEEQVAYTKAAEIGKKYYDRIVAGDLVALANELLANLQPAPAPVPNEEGVLPPAPKTPDEIRTESQPIIDSGDIVKIAALVGERITYELELEGFPALLQVAKDSAPAAEEEVVEEAA